MKSHENQPETIKENTKTYENQPETIKENMKTYENTLKNHEDQPKIVKNHNIKNIINDGQVQIIASVAMVTAVQKTSPQKKDHRHHSATKI